MTDLEQELTDHLRRRAAAVVPRPDLGAIEQGTASAGFLRTDDRPSRRPLIGAAIALAAAAVIVVALLAVRTPDEGSTAVTGPTVGTEDDGPTAATSGGMWPKMSAAEVREAQELADAGDRAYAWQVDPGLSDIMWDANLQEGTELVDRFMHEVLGWDRFVLLEGGVAETDAAGRSIGGLFVRCEPGVMNPLYPESPSEDQGACAPTIDDRHYEAVDIRLLQPAEQGDDGIWVVEEWAKVAPVAQTNPEVVEDEATERVEDFLRARIDGAGAEGYITRVVGADGQPLEEVPLLYAASTGAPYERYEIEVPTYPHWPDGATDLAVRLYADGGRTLVDQVISARRSDDGQLELWLLDGLTQEHSEPVPP